MHKNSLQKSLSYAEAGVNIPKLDRFKKGLAAPIQKTFGPEVLSKIGGFGGLFHFDKKKFRDPVLVSSVDGVGTKLKIAVMMNRHDTVGMDIVGHCANDIVVQGAQPLFFLDYIGTGCMDPKVGKAIIRGLVEGCRRAECALIGGETAEMPSMYGQGEYDLVGTIVGVVERSQIIDGSKVKAGDTILGLASNGLHTNGYSLARKIFFDVLGWTVDRRVPELRTTLGEALLAPHTCYSRAILRVARDVRINALSHLTGGGFQGNIPRVLPEGCRAVIYRGSWDVPPIFEIMQQAGKITDEEMHRTFNMGVGMAVIVPAGATARTADLFKKQGFPCRVIGEIVKGKKSVVFNNE